MVKKTEKKEYCIKGWISLDAVFYITASSPIDAEAKVGAGQWDSYEVQDARDWETTHDAVENE